MYSELYIPVIRTLCPQTMDEEKCPVRQYLKNNNSLFNVSVYGTILIPKSYDTGKLANGITKLRKMCNECEKTNER